MSIKNVEKFLNLAKTDEDLKIKLVDVSRSLQKNGGKIPNEEKFIKDKIVPLARKKGVLFTAKDFLKYADKQVTTLSEEDLLNVSGGLSNRTTAAVLLTTFLGSLGVGAAVNLSNLAQDDQISISARKGNTDGGEKFSHENSDEYETKTENNGVIPKIPGLDGNVKTAQNSSAEKREESQPSVGENNIEENVVEAKQKNTTAQENLRQVMQNKNVVLPNTNINPVLDTTEINITGESRNAADLTSAGGVPPEAGIEHDVVEFHDDGSVENDSISPMGSGFLDKSTSEFSASSRSGVNKGDDSVVNDSMFGTKSSFWGSGSKRFLTSSGSTLNGTLTRSKSVASFRPSSGSDSDILGKGSVDDSSIHTGSSKFNISSTTDSIGGSMKRSQSFSDFNLMASKEDSNHHNKILNDSMTDSPGASTNSVNSSTNSANNLPKILGTSMNSANSSTNSENNAQGQAQQPQTPSVNNDQAQVTPNEAPAWRNNNTRQNSSMNSANNSTSSMEAKNFGSTGSFGSAFNVQNDEDDDFFPELVISQDGNIRYAYYEGTNEHVYEFDETTGTLTIFKDFDDGETAYISDWEGLKDNIEKVIIKDGVTSIADKMFYEFSNLTEITIPDSVTAIGVLAFFSCINLTEITIPGSVKEIEECAFLNCANLEKIELQNGVTSIGRAAFSGCDKLTEITIPATVNFICENAFEECKSLRIVNYKGTTPPDQSGQVFVGVDPDLVINVPEDYEGDSFCGLDVTKGAQQQVEINASTNVGHMNEEDVSPQPGFFRRVVNGVVNFFTAAKNVLTESDSSVGKEFSDDENDDVFFDSSFFEYNDSQSQIPGQQQPQTSSENNAQAQAQQPQTSSENNAQGQDQQSQAPTENDAQTPQQDQDEVEAKNFLDDAFNEAEKKLAEARWAEARWAEDKLAVFKSLNFQYGEEEYESFDFGSGTYSNEELAKHILNSLDKFESLTPKSQRELMMDTIALFASVENKEKAVYELALLFDDDAAISQEERQKLEDFYFGKVEPHLWEIEFPTNEYEELLTINNKPKTVEYILEFLDPYLGKFNNNELDERSRDVLLHYIDDLLYKFYDEKTNEIKVPLDEDDGGHTREILEKMLNIAKENILNQGEGDTEDYKFSIKEATKAAAISIALVGLTVGAAYATAYVTVGAPVLSGISFWGDANIENAKAKITNGINTITASATDVVNALKSKVSSGLSAAKAWWNGKSTNNTQQHNNASTDLWIPLGDEDNNLLPHALLDPNKTPEKRTVEFLNENNIKYVDEKPTFNLDTNVPPTANDGYVSKAWNWTKNTAGNAWNWFRNRENTNAKNTVFPHIPGSNPGNSTKKAVNSTQPANATPIQNPAPQPNNYTAANANITNNLTASATNIANEAKPGVSSAYKSAKGRGNRGDTPLSADKSGTFNIVETGEHSTNTTPIEKTAAYFGGNTSNIPINFPELREDEQQKPGRRQITSLRSYLDGQEVNLPRDPQPQSSPTVQNSPITPKSTEVAIFRGSPESPANGSGAIQAVAPQTNTGNSKSTEVAIFRGSPKPPANVSGTMQAAKAQNTSTSVVDPSGKLPTNVTITRKAGMSPAEVSKVFLQNQGGKVERQSVENPQNPANDAFATAQNSPIRSGTEGWSQENFIRRVPADGSAIKTPSTEQNSPITPKSTAVANTDSNINEIPSALQTVQFFKGNQLVDAERPGPKLEPETHNKPTNSPFNMDGFGWQGAGNSTQPANATPMQNPAPQPNNYTAANANITNNLTASATNIANVLKSKASSAISAVKGWMNGKRTPIEKTAAYFGDNTSSIPINFPELGADEQRQGAGNSTQPVNATQPQMPAVASNSSKNISKNDVVQGINTGVTALGLGAAVVYGVNEGVNYYNDLVTYNRITKTLTIKKDMTEDLDNSISNHEAIGIDEAKTIVISDGVEKVTLYGGDFPNVEKIIVSKTVRKLDLNETDNNFDSIKEIKVDKNNPDYESIDGVLFAKDDSNDEFVLIKFPRGKTDIEYKVPKNVTYIEGNAFDTCPNLERIIIENDLWLASKSFCFCPNLKEVRFDSQTDDVYKNDDSFYVCNNAKLYMTNIDQSQLPDELYGLEVAKDTSE